MTQETSICVYSVLKVFVYKPQWGIGFMGFKQLYSGFHGSIWCFFFHMLVVNPFQAIETYIYTIYIYIQYICIYVYIYT